MEEDSYIFPTDFVIIHESIYNLIKQLWNIAINSDYEINFGKTSLYLRLKYDNKIYIYNYNNGSFNICGIIELFADAWKYIYDKYLLKKHLIII